jgi:hypothetical protein
MADLTEIRAAVKATLPEAVTRDATVTVRIGPRDYDARGFDKQRILTRIIVGHEGDPDAEKRLDDLLTAPVKEALEADDTLGGLVADITVTRTSGYQTYRAADGEQLLGAEWTADVLID